MHVSLCARFIRHVFLLRKVTAVCDYAAVFQCLIFARVEFVPSSVWSLAYVIVSQPSNCSSPLVFLGIELYRAYRHWYIVTNYNVDPLPIVGNKRCTAADIGVCSNPPPLSKCVGTYLN